MSRLHVIIDYTNYRGERAERVIQPEGLRWGQSDFHKDGLQWFLLATDVTRGVQREFAMKDIHSWRQAPPSPPQPPQDTAPETGDCPAERGEWCPDPRCNPKCRRAALKETPDGTR